MSLETFLRTTAFFGIIIVDVVVVVVILLPVSIVEIATNKNLGTYDAIEKMYKFAEEIGKYN